MVDSTNEVRIIPFLTYISLYRQDLKDRVWSSEGLDPRFYESIITNTHCFDPQNKKWVVHGDKDAWLGIKECESLLAEAKDRWYEDISCQECVW